MYLLPLVTNGRYDLTAEGCGRARSRSLDSRLQRGDVGDLKRHHFGVYHGVDARGDPSTRGFVKSLPDCRVVLYGFVAPLAAGCERDPLVSTGATLAVVAIGLKCWNSWTRNTPAVLWSWLTATMMLPVVTVLGQGFLGYGFAAMLTVFAFVASFFRPRWKVVVLATVLGYLGLSVYVELHAGPPRHSRVGSWSGASVQDRVDQLTATFATSEWFSTDNVDHLNLNRLAPESGLPDRRRRGTTSAAASPSMPGARRSGTPRCPSFHAPCGPTSRSSAAAATS